MGIIVSVIVAAVVVSAGYLVSQATLNARAARERRQQEEFDAMVSKEAERIADEAAQAALTPRPSPSEKFLGTMSRGDALASLANAITDTPPLETVLVKDASASLRPAAAPAGEEMKTGDITSAKHPVPYNTNPAKTPVLRGFAAQAISQIMAEHQVSNFFQTSGDIMTPEPESPADQAFRERCEVEVMPAFHEAISILRAQHDAEIGSLVAEVKLLRTACRNAGIKVRRLPRQRKAKAAKKA